jgi:hypothetical protein
MRMKALNPAAPGTNEHESRHTIMNVLIMSPLLLLAPAVRNATERRRQVLVIAVRLSTKRMMVGSHGDAAAWYPLARRQAVPTVMAVAVNVAERLSLGTAMTTGQSPPPSAANVFPRNLTVQKRTIELTSQTFTAKGDVSEMNGKLAMCGTGSGSMANVNVVLSLKGDGHVSIW